MSTRDPRRRDPTPISRTGEVALLVLGAAVTAIALTALAGMGLAAAIAGGGWVWPHGSHTIGATVVGLVSGHPGQGLPPEQAADLPSAAVIYTGVAVGELLLLATCVTVANVIVRYHRPGGARRGMASRRDAQHALGIGQLRAARSLIRPDRYPPPKRAAREGVRR